MSHSTKKQELALGILALVFSIYSAHGQQMKPGERLKFVLVLTRHGVRSPTWTNARLDEYAKKPWPKWDVAPGILTPHGKALMTLFGAYYRESFAAQGLLSKADCRDAKNLHIYADTDQRTVETGRGLADGLMPGCNLEVHSLQDAEQDELFHTAGKIGKPNAALALAAVAGRIGNHPEELLPAYQMQLREMQNVLTQCDAAQCIVGDGEKNLLETPPELAEGKGDHLVDIKGPLSIGGTFAEDFQLEYLEGMPDAQVGWGRVDEAKMRALMAIHAASSDVLQRTPYLARTQASNLLDHILRTLQQGELNKKVAGAIGATEDKVVFLVGHDTNISNVAALLDAHWLVEGYQKDDAAPGGALVFEVWRRAGMGDVVRMHYMVQSPAQMRTATPLSVANPPAEAVIFLPGCSQAASGSPCEWSAFQKMVSAAIDPNFVR